MDHILAVLRLPVEQASGFTALGEIAGALDGNLSLFAYNYFPLARCSMSLQNYFSLEVLI